MSYCPAHRSARWLLRLFAIAAVCAYAPVLWAGDLYRCSGVKGEIAYTNRIGGYVNCTKVASFADAPAKAAAPNPAHAANSTAPATAPQGQWQYRDAPATSDSSDPVPTAPAVAAPEPPKVLRGAVYKVNKANGITEYTNIRPAGRGYRVLFTYISTCFACDIHSKVNFRSTVLNRDAYRSEIAAAAVEFGVDESLLRAVVHAESAFNPNALSNKGAQGLMQLMPGTADDLGVVNPFDATQNIRGGAQYLAGLLKSFSGDENRAVAAYNAGPANVQKYGGIPPFDETRVYVSRVNTLRERYRQTN
ncbi:MAG: lytic transglycosylase domain-containing protein [Tahibacter sp.]